MPASKRFQTRPEGAEALTSRPPQGRIEVLPEVVASVAAHAALECYGVMGLASQGLVDGLAVRLQPHGSQRGVHVRFEDEGLVVDLFIIALYGAHILEVAHNLMETVKFALERALGLTVKQVNVVVQGVREGSQGA